MEPKNFGYSLKNIPLPNPKTYTKLMIDKTHNFLKRLRWKAFYFDNPADSDRENSKTFGFKSEKSPPQNKDLQEFENDMYSMIKNIKYKESRPSEFQCQLSKDLKEMQNSKDLYVPADKTTNIYKVSSEKYQQLLHSNITANYRKADNDAKVKNRQRSQKYCRKTSSLQQG